MLIEGQMAHYILITIVILLLVWIWSLWLVSSSPLCAGASKGGLDMLTKVMGLELAPHKVKYLLFSVFTYPLGFTKVRHLSQACYSQCTVPALPLVPGYLGSLP